MNPWTLDPAVTFLNHGAFGACPEPVLALQRRYQDEMEAQPLAFLDRRLWGLLQEAREALAGFLGADPENLAFVPNATTGVNTVLASYPLDPGDEILTTDHAYNACLNALQAAASRTGARVRIAALPLPVTEPLQWVDAISSQVGPRTRLVMIDHVTSVSAAVLPVEAIARALADRPIDLLVDGAHAPGQIPLDLDGLGVAFYAGNCHKWLCAPKGSGFLHVRADRRDTVRPLAISHGANSPRTDRSRFHLEFDWCGTYDPTPYLCVPEAIACLGRLRPGGWPELRESNRNRAIAGRALLLAALGGDPLVPEDMIGSMASVRLPPATDPLPTLPPVWDRLQQRLFEKHAIEVPVFAFPGAPGRILRLSMQAYNTLDQVRTLADALVAELAAETRR